MKGFKPKTICFICNWCSLQSADFIGVTRLYFPHEITSIRVPCSGRINPEVVAECFLNFADGVLIMGCTKGKCNYRTGNYQAERTVSACKEVLKLSSVNPERLSLHLESDVEIPKVYEDFTKKIETLGPLEPESPEDKENLKILLMAARDTLLDEDLKWLVAREWTLVTQGNAYGERLEQEKFDAILLERIRDQFLISRVSHLIKEVPLSVMEISDRLKVEPEKVFEAIVEIKRKGLVIKVDVVDRNPRYLMV